MRPTDDLLTKEQAIPSSRQVLLFVGAGLIAILSAAPASSQCIGSYGKGTAGTRAVVPLLWVNSMPRPGNARFAVTFERGRPNSTAIPFLGFKKSAINLGGVTLLVDPRNWLQLPTVKLDSSGAGRLPLPLPNSARLIGASVFFQAFLPDLGGPAALGFSATRGLAVKIPNSGLLLGTSPTGKASTPQIAINLGTGALRTFSHPSMTNVGVSGIYPRGSTHCILPSLRTNKIALFDCLVYPPRFLREISPIYGPLRGPVSATWNPDGTRLYVVNNCNPKFQTTVDVYWGVPTAQNFGAVFPGGSIPLGKTVVATKIEFTSDGNIGILSNPGFGGAHVAKYDTKLGSPTYHKVLGSFFARGGFMWDSCKIDDRYFAVGDTGIGRFTTIKIIDINTMKRVQSYGGMRFGTLVSGMVADRRGRYLYVGNQPWRTVAGNIVRINIDKADPGFGKIVTITAGINPKSKVVDIVVNDAADRMYATTYSPLGFGVINEYDTKTLRLLRTWNLSRYISLNGLLIR